MAPSAGRRTGANMAEPTARAAFCRISTQVWKQAAQTVMACCPQPERGTAVRRLARAVAAADGGCEDDDTQAAAESDSESQQDVNEPDSDSESAFSFGGHGDATEPDTPAHREDTLPSRVFPWSGLLPAPLVRLPLLPARLLQPSMRLVLCPRAWA